MRSWAGLTPWKRASGTLAVLTEHDFQRAVLPYFRVWWPTMVEVPDRKWWDRCGIDLLTPEEPHFACVVQCKGFHVQELGRDQIRQACDSIDRFQRSDVSAECFIVVHNRDGRFREFTTTVAGRLSILVETGRVARAELWDRQTLLNQTCDRLQTMLAGAIRQHANRLAEIFDDLLPYAREHVERVPARESLVRLRRGEGFSITEIRPMADRPVNCHLLANDVRWTLLIGAFGAGKTTTVLQTAQSSQRSVLVIPCSTLPPEQIFSSTNLLLETVALELGLFGELSEDDREILADLVGGVMTYIFSHEQSDFALVIDGLDENRVYATLVGLQRLMNQLADVKVPVIFTTRQEHFFSMFGDFSAILTEISQKKGKKPGRLFELGAWNARHVKSLLTQISHKLAGEELLRIDQLRKLVESGHHRDLYGDLLDSPLFVQFVIEDVIERGVNHSGRVDQLRRWVARKIYRDRVTRVGKLLSDRTPLGLDNVDTEEIVSMIVTISENISSRMTVRKDGRYELAEFIQSSEVLEETQKVFIGSSTSLLSLLLHSFFLPRFFRKGSSLEVRFAFRILHEYFLASFLSRQRLPADFYPEVVQSLWNEITLGPRLHDGRG